MYPEHLVTKMLEDIEAATNLETRIQLSGGVWTNEDSEKLTTLHRNVVEIRETLDKIRLNSELTKMELSSTYGKTPIYKDTDSLGVGPFKTIELFPNENGRPAIHCTECGAYVTITKQTMHTNWHNKIADL